MMVFNYVKLLLLFLLISFIVCLPAFSWEFDVGGEEGWEVPSSKYPQMYNQWASKDRFNVGDIVKFKYKKDSVLVVTEEEYEKCKSTRPAFFSNSGNTEYKLNHSGTFYFISGAADHCERGQKMIIKVISHSDSPGTSPPSPDSSDSTNLVAGSVVACLPIVIASSGILLVF